ncbi:hypothetical protein IMZ08_07990 [Bacillus luteolus]|uniref:LysM domain-containing protein n=1 Tax=Litchfieldia luteola TaxID=682179 RepID=A0ABR9QHK9_9BACI|nr:hypothetical protein [Cytobacillus luteolus]MBE4907990.1 hypothetical protein [Cytobacillus luteolus]MBP1942772.1 hypothetical protein [Cytobacillus luteolus]
MKKFIGVLLALFLLYIVYHDVTQGTLPSMKEQPVAAAAAEQVSKPIENTTIPFQIVKIKAGDTVLSLTESLSTGNVSIEKIISDFEELNPKATANSIIIGKEYKIPVYSEGE